MLTIFQADSSGDSQAEQGALVRSRWARLAKLVAGVAFLTLCARINVPFWPVPMTMQTFGVMLLALMWGRSCAVQVFVAYLATGATGLPVFAGAPEHGTGLAYMAGPTGGYLLGFLAASWLVGGFSDHARFSARCAALLAGLVAVYLCGLAGLAFYVPWERLPEIGLWPFVAGDLAKLTLVIAIASFK